MRGMILAAGLGERVRPLSTLRAKPALPVRGMPVIGYGLRLLAHHGIREVVVNRHHLADDLTARSEAACPAGLSLRWSDEPQLLGTGGAIRKVARWLREEDTCLLLAGDMLLDADLTKLLDRHRAQKAAVTFLLKEDRRGSLFGTIGVDSAGRVRRIGSHFDLGGEVRAGVYAHATVLSTEAFVTLPDRDAFNHLTDWVVPRLAEGAEDVFGDVCAEGECTWEPVGTPAEYLAVNLRAPALSYADPDALLAETGTRCEGSNVIGSDARLGRGARLERCVVWDGERVPENFVGHDGVFAGGSFHSCAAGPESREAE